MLSLTGTFLSSLRQKLTKQVTIFVVLCVILLAEQTIGSQEVVWAVNCGGGAHTDVHGVRYQADSLQIGFASDYGKSLTIQRVVPQDQILYQTERYHRSTFGYDIPVTKDGDYVLVLKFSEVWFTASSQKVFDVILNGEHTIVNELDIYAKVGRGVAHDEVIPFSIKNGKLRVNGESSTIDGKISVEFLKGDLDNPKVNAIYVIKGTFDDIPKLPPLPGGDNPDDIEEDEEEDTEVPKPAKSRRPSGPKAKDPYATDDTSTMLLPVFLAIAAFIPLLFCLCKL